MAADGAELTAWLAEEVRLPVHPAVVAAAEEIRRRHGATTAAVLFYGSCLRRGDESPGVPEGILDFYALVDRYREAYRGRLRAAANALLPPNVFYVEVAWRGQPVRTKYAVMTLAQFRRGTSRRSFHSSLWARFAQPARLVYARDEGARRAVVGALADAVVTLVGRAAPLLGDRFSAAELWRRAFEETYRAELRAEAPGQARRIYESGCERYNRLTPWALGASGLTWTAAPDGGFALRPGQSAHGRLRARALWAARRFAGKALSAARLVKAFFTFEGGVDYVLWKIERHTGVRPELTPWQRRHPLLASPLVLWRLYRRGAIR